MVVFNAADLVGDRQASRALAERIASSLNPSPCNSTST
jgi:hypothetical protein